MEFFNNVQLLTEGAFGPLHICERKHNKLKIVVKSIKLVNDDVVEQIKKEVALFKSLDNPNLLQYYDNFVKDKVLYITMEYATKGTLAELIYKADSEKLKPQKVMNIFSQILMGLHYMHNRNILHRDLSCDTIFLTGLQGDVVKVGGFGISYILTRKGIGYPDKNYRNKAPEILDGKAHNAKSDIWSLGCLLYELCTLESMFGITLYQAVLNIAGGKKKKIDVDFYGIQLQIIIEKMLQTDPIERPDTTELMTIPDIFPSMNILGSILGCII